MISFLVGVLTGHLFYFLVEIVPYETGYTLLKTPNFLIDLFEGSFLHFDISYLICYGFIK